jgi:hypothetical protein
MYLIRQILFSYGPSWGSRNLEHEEAKARYRAVNIQQTKWVVTPGKQTNKLSVLIIFKPFPFFAFPNKFLYTRLFPPVSATCFSYLVPPAIW